MLVSFFLLYTIMNRYIMYAINDVAEIMIQGIIMGVIECEKIINRDLDLSKSTNMLLHEFSKFQKESIEKLSKYL